MKNKDIDLLIKIENALGEIVGNDDCPLEYDDFVAYWNLVERVINDREKNRKRTRKAINDKRKDNPYYGRSKKEIEKREKARLKKEAKNERK